MKRANKSIYSILGILSSESRSGYDIKKVIEMSIGHFWAESYGQIYPTLKMLIDEGLITITEGSDSGKLERKVYSITEKGTEELKRWLNETVEEISLARNELLLKLFFGSRIPAEKNIGHIINYRKRLEKELEMFDDIAELINRTNDKQTSTVYQYLTLKHGQAICEALIRWCDDSVNALKEL
jgi:DNA-binding PadR family transcriptional regulator